MEERQKVWLIGASTTKLFTGMVGAKHSFRKVERARKLEMQGKVKFWNTWNDKLQSLYLGLKRQGNKVSWCTALLVDQAVTLLHLSLTKNWSLASGKLLKVCLRIPASKLWMITPTLIGMIWG